MSFRPGVSVIPRTNPRPRSAPTDVGLWHVVGLTDAGPLVPRLITSMQEYETLFGPRVSYSVLYDALDLYFREGGSRAYISRVVGPAATTGTKNLLDAGAAISLVASALGPGAGSANISVGVRLGVGAGTFVVFVVVGGIEVETSPDLVDNQAAVTWSANSNYIRLTLGASANDPAAVAAGPLSAGADDRAAITDTHRQLALDRLAADLGPGQVSMPGVTTSTVHTMLLAHARLNRRVAILDVPDSPTGATITGAATSARAAGDGRYGGLFWPWVIAPGVVFGTTRSIPPSGLIAGLIARNDGRGLGPADPAAGDLGDSSFATDLTQPAVDNLTRQNYNAAGVNVVRRMFGGIRNYGWRSVVDPINEIDWRSLSAARIYMAVAANGASIAEAFVFDKIDGRGRKIAEFGGALTGMLQSWFLSGDLYGQTAEEAFFVDTGNQVNTLQTLSNDELHAVLNIKVSPYGEFVQIEVVKLRLNEGVS